MEGQLLDRSWGWVFPLLFVVISGAAVGLADPRKSRRNKFVYWLVPPITGFVLFFIATGTVTFGLLCAGMALFVTGIGWLQYYRPGPGMFNR